MVLFSFVFFFHRSSSFLRGKREMAINTKYAKSVQGLLKILELVSISRKIKPFLIDLGYVKLTSFWK